MAKNIKRDGIGIYRLEIRSESGKYKFTYADESGEPVFSSVPYGSKAKAAKTAIELSEKLEVPVYDFARSRGVKLLSGQKYVDIAVEKMRNE